MEMKSVLQWLAGLFHVEVVWIDKGQGRWVRRWRFHPFLNCAAVVGVLYLAWVGGASLFRPSAPKEPQISPPAHISHPPPSERKITELGIHDFFSEPAAEPAPGPIPSDLIVNDDEYWLRVDKRNYRLYLYRGLDVDKSYSVAVGKNPGDKVRTGDNRTPNGIFTVQSIEDARSWTHDFRDGKGIIRGAYGPWFIRLRTGWQGIGIHGTHDPDSRGSMASEGCIRMLNDELEEVKSFAFRNMKVVIEE